MFLLKKIKDFFYSNKKSFTLLEMLVVIGIIAVIIGFGAVSYSSAQRRARDAKRRADLKAIQNAMEQYYSVARYVYPTNIPGPGGEIRLTTGQASWIRSDIVFFKMPVDPLGGAYQCINCNAEQYEICPPDLGGGRYFESWNCNSTNKSCCLRNLQ